MKFNLTILRNGLLLGALIASTGLFAMEKPDLKATLQNDLAQIQKAIDQHNNKQSTAKNFPRPANLMSLMPTDNAKKKLENYLTVRALFEQCLYNPIAPRRPKANVRSFDDVRQAHQQLLDALDGRTTVIPTIQPTPPSQTPVAPQPRPVVTPQAAPRTTPITQTPTQPVSTLTAQEREEQEIAEAIKLSLREAQAAARVEQITPQPRQTPTATIPARPTQPTSPVVPVRPSPTRTTTNTSTTVASVPTRQPATRQTSTPVRPVTPTRTNANAANTTSSAVTPATEEDRTQRLQTINRQLATAQQLFEDTRAKKQAEDEALARQQEEAATAEQHELDLAMAMSLQKQQSLPDNQKKESYQEYIQALTTLKQKLNALADQDDAEDYYQKSTEVFSMIEKLKWANKEYSERERDEKEAFDTLKTISSQDELVATAVEQNNLELVKYCVEVEKQNSHTQLTKALQAARNNNAIKEYIQQALIKPIENSATSTQNEAADCPICLEKLTPGQSYISSNCGHGICNECLPGFRSQYDRRCPICRHEEFLNAHTQQTRQNIPTPRITTHTTSPVIITAPALSRYNLQDFAEQCYDNPSNHILVRNLGWCLELSIEKMDVRPHHYDGLKFTITRFNGSQDIYIFDGFEFTTSERTHNINIIANALNSFIFADERLMRNQGHRLVERYQL